MIVKFLGNKGGGSAGATIDYLLGKDRDRPGAVLLSGDPELTQRLADNLDFQNRYTVGVLSFEESNLEEQQKEAIIQTLYPNNDFQSFTSNYFSVIQFYTSKIRSP